MADDRRDRDKFMELTRGVGELAKGTNNEDQKLDLFLGLFHPEMSDKRRKEIRDARRK